MGSVDNASLWRFSHTTVNINRCFGRAGSAEHLSKEGAMNREKLLEVYRKADDNGRLSLFLGYRELRDDFALIDQESEHDDFVIIRFPWSRKHWHKQRLVPRAA